MEPIARMEDLVLTVSAGAFSTRIAVGDIAHCWRALSFIPERRAAFELGALAGRLNLFQAHLENLTAAGGQVDPAELETFARRHTALTRRAWLVESGCMSSMVVGPARFPVERNRKKLAASDRAFGLVRDNERAARQAVERRAFPHGRPDGAIRANNPDAPNLIRARIEQHKSIHAALKAANAALRALPADAGEDAMTQAIVDATGWREALARKAATPDTLGRRGFATEALAGELAEIKRLEDRLRLIERNRASGTVSRSVETAFGDVEIVEDGDAARIRLIFPGKPDEHVRGLLKSNAFRWSPSEGAWQRHLNERGRWAVERVLAGIGGGVRQASETAA